MARGGADEATGAGAGAVGVTGAPPEIVRARVMAGAGLAPTDGGGAVLAAGLVACGVLDMTPVAVLPAGVALRLLLTGTPGRVLLGLAIGGAAAVSGADAGLGAMGAGAAATAGGAGENTP